MICLHMNQTAHVAGNFNCLFENVNVVISRKWYQIESLVLVTTSTK